MTIPKVIHFNWHTLPIDVKWQGTMALWEQTMPGWETRLWTAADTHSLPFPELEKLARNYAEWSDINRYRALCLGGLYADLDTRPMFDFTSDLESVETLITPEINSPGSKMPNSWYACNWLLGGSPQDKFWEHVCRRMMPWYENNEAGWREQAAKKGEPLTMWKTGPRFLARILREYNDWAWGPESAVEGPETRAGVTLWPNDYILWCNRRWWSDMQSVSPGVRAVHLYGGDWTKQDKQWPEPIA